MSGVVVRDPGFLTIVVDGGRVGWQALGVPVCGPMDRVAFLQGNHVVGNPPMAASLEATLNGPVLSFERPARVAITGAPWRVRFGARDATSPVVGDIGAGEVLTFVERLAGARAYLAVAGGFDVPQVLGSRSTDMRSGFGGFRGRPLRAGDRLAVGTGPLESPVPSVESAALLDAVPRLRVLPGPTAHDWTRAALAELVSRDWLVSPRSDRMGYRLEGEPLSMASMTGRMLSAPTVTGALQVPPDGRPILLMADRQTTGGYPVAAVVISADLPVAGQLLPGAGVSFELVTREAALRALSDQEARLRPAGR